MARTRALLTERDRELISGGEASSENRRYHAISEVRARIQENLPGDITVLEEYHPELLAELRAVVGVDGSAQSGADPEQQLRYLSQTLDLPIVVGETVYEDGDQHSLAESEERE